MINEEQLVMIPAAITEDGWESYLINFGGEILKTDESFIVSEFFGIGDNRFIILSPDYGNYWVLNNGDKVPIDPELIFDEFSIAPDQQQYIAYLGDVINSPIYLNGELLYKFENDKKIRDIIWRPDAQGILILFEKEIYYMDLQASAPYLIDQCTHEDCYIELWTQWIP